jgi:hypothetical protein
MIDRAALVRLRSLLFLLAASLYCGTIADLLAAKHYQSLLQFVPFGLCALGLVTVALVWKRPEPRIVAAARFAMLVIAGGSLLGIYEHIAGNLNFVHEVRPHADGMTLLKATLQGGDPILAPGVLAVAAAVTILATFTSSVITRGSAERPIEESRQRSMQGEAIT